MALVGMSANAGQIGEADRQRLVDVIVRDSADVLARYSDERGLWYEAVERQWPQTEVRCEREHRSAS